MGLLKVRKNGQVMLEFSLPSGGKGQDSEFSTVIVGRSSQCQIVLDHEQGISRRHFQLTFEAGSWILSPLSDHGSFLYRGDPISSPIVLQTGDVFSLTPYEFEFQEDLLSQSSQSSSPPESFDGTLVIPLNQMGAYLKRKKPDTEEFTQLYKLEGERWMAGRDPQCAIFIDQKDVSRKHFEIFKNKDSYFIKDLGSSNGTLLNGELLPKEELKSLQSGDVITISGESFLFEIRDESLEKVLEEAGELLPSLPVPAEGMGGVGMSSLENGPVDRSPREGLPHSKARRRSSSHFPSSSRSSSPLRILSLGLILSGLLFYLWEEDNSSSRVGSDSGVQRKSLNSENGESGLGRIGDRAKLNPFDSLPKEKKDYVRQVYLAGQTLFQQGKYELAQQEMNRIHSLIPQYEDSRQIESLTAQALDRIRELREQERKEKEKAQMEEKIQKQVALCHQRLNPNIEMDEVETCLSSVVEFRPDHPSFVVLRGEAEKIIAQRTLRRVEASEKQTRVRRLTALFEKAETQRVQGDEETAISTYEAVIRSSLPDPHRLKDKARRTIASLRQGHIDQQMEIDRKAEAAIKENRLREAVILIKKALELSPENEVMKGRLESIYSSLKKTMQPLYEEAIMEESIGELEPAKAKWKKIIQDSVPGEEYYRKAKMKLNKYESP